MVELEEVGVVSATLRTLIAPLIPVDVDDLLEPVVADIAQVLLV